MRDKLISMAQGYAHLESLRQMKTVMLSNPQWIQPTLVEAAHCWIDNEISELEAILFPGQNEKATGQGDLIEKAALENVYASSIPAIEQIDKEVQIDA